MSYITGDWLTDIESSCDSSSNECEEDKVSAHMIETTFPTLPPPTSSYTHLCLMPKGYWQ